MATKFTNCRFSDADMDNIHVDGEADLELENCDVSGAGRHNVFINANPISRDLYEEIKREVTKGVPPSQIAKTFSDRLRKYGHDAATLIGAAADGAAVLASLTPLLRLSGA